MSFLEEAPTPLRVVLKPRRGSSSLRVGLARSMHEARGQFTAILADPSSLDDDGDGGSTTAYSVLLQEYLSDAGSAEWVVDTVSRGGEHKVVALWRYDKRDYYGSPELRVKVRVRDGVRMRVQSQVPTPTPTR